MTTRARRGHRLIRPVVVAAIVAATAIVVTQGGVHAAPIVIGPTEITDGALHLTPGVQAVRGNEAVWVLANGSDRSVTFALSLHEVVVGQDGRAAVGPTVSSLPPADEVALAPREQARIAVALETTDAVALQAATDGAPTLHAFAVRPGDGDVAAQVTLDNAHGRAEVTLSADTPTVATVSVTVAGWPGRDLGTATIGPIPVVPPGITLTADIQGAVGPTTVEVAATTTGGVTATARVSAFVVTRNELTVAAVIILALSVTCLAVVLRRRRRGAQPTPGQP